MEKEKVAHIAWFPIGYLCFDYNGVLILFENADEDLDKIIAKLKDLGYEVRESDFAKSLGRRKIREGLVKAG